MVYKVWSPNQQDLDYQTVLLEIQIIRLHPDLQILDSGDGAQESTVSQARQVILSPAKVQEPLP